MRNPHDKLGTSKLGHPVLTLWHITSFQDSVGWTVFDVATRVEKPVLQVIWHQRADRVRIEKLMFGRVESTHAQPTLSVNEFAMDEVIFASALEALASITVPVAVHHADGFDGDTYGVKLHRQVEFEWWCSGPKEWAPLVAWLGRFMDHLQALTPAP